MEREAFRRAPTARLKPSRDDIDTVHYRPLGRTGLTVSALSLGTVSLGVDYGIAAPGAFGRPSRDEAEALVRSALDRGITLIDTAPAYGDAERIVGRAIANDARAIVATKVSLPSHPSERDRGAAVDASIEQSRRALGRDVLDIVQIHSATRAAIDDRAIIEPLLDSQRRGLVRVLGATVYDSAAALAAIASREYAMLQVALNVLDQRMMREVIPAAAAAGVGILVRSALLKGALTPKAQWLPEPLAALRRAASRARDRIAGGAWDRLPESAMRFCLSAPHVTSVLVGARTSAELDAALAAEATGPLDDETMAGAAALALDDDLLLNPSHWPVA
jgi:aryl-alcohol dehydrogenase-like predicted oxidoreductase